jgi:hypothetical protein
MAEWKSLSSYWDVREEELSNGCVMYCYRRPKGWAPGVGNGSIDSCEIVVYSSSDARTSSRLDDFRIEPSNLLVLECIAHEMRTKYGAHS